MRPPGKQLKIVFVMELAAVGLLGLPGVVSAANFAAGGRRPVNCSSRKTFSCIATTTSFKKRQLRLSSRAQQ